MTKQEFIRKIRQKGIPIYKKPIKLKECMGSGGFATVYSISPRRVVKVFDRDPRSVQYIFALDEIRGSKLFKNALPVLGICFIEAGSLDIDILGPCVGLIKRKLKEIPREKWYSKTCKQFHRSWDAWQGNYGIDSRGKVYRIDTGTRATMDL